VLTVTALDLEKWAETVSAKAELPWLLRRLVWASCSEIGKLEFPGGHHVYLGGFDGVVDCGRGNHIVPPGVSGWELTTEKNVTGKANADFEKRTDDSKGFDRNKTTFIFATPCRWPTGREWEKEKKAARQWRDVRVVLSDDLETWMDEVPWLATEFARLCLGKNVAGLRSIEIVWSIYSNVPTPNGTPLGPDLIVGNRKSILGQLTNWIGNEIMGSERLLRIAASSEREALDFVAAGIRSATEYDKLASRVVIVDDEASARSLRGISAHHTLLGTGSVVPYVVALSQKTNCKVIIYYSRGNSVGNPLPWIPKIDLEPLAKNDMVRAVTAFGYPAEEAARLCEENLFDYERIRKCVFLC
jgi:hypothetical protein